MEYRLKEGYRSTQFARALEELGVRIIYAYSPQAKGRIERKFGVFPRLWRGSELRLHNISTLEEANRYLWEKFMPIPLCGTPEPPKSLVLLIGPYQKA